MKIAVLIVSRNRPDLVEEAVVNVKACASQPYDLHVVECGTDPDKMSPHSTLWFADPDFRGKAFGHNVALKAAQLSGAYDYYWILMNDVRFDPAQKPMQTLIETMDANPRMAILAPTERGHTYPGGEPRAGGGWRPITTSDYLGFMMRGQAIEEVGFLNPDFKYCWGAIHELSYRLYEKDWFLAFSDDVIFKHLGGTTYGQKNTRTISREAYKRRAKRFALTHMVENYGWRWADRFWQAASRRHHIEVNTFETHRRMWAEAFTRDELIELAARAGELFQAAQAEPASVAIPAPATQISANVFAGMLTQPNATLRTQSDGSVVREPSAAAPAHVAPSVPTAEASSSSAAETIAAWRAAGAPVRLHLGAGPEKRKGWLNVDVNPGYHPEIVAEADQLPMVPDGVVDEIESHHLFEHLHYSQAIAALKEWRRVLRPGGKVSLELPNLDACFRIMGQATDSHGFDIGIIGIFGWPPAIDQEGVPQIHKWGWTPESLSHALRDAGFTDVVERPITQTWRPAARLGRDMRIEARVPAGAVTTPSKSIAAGASPTPTPTPTEPWAITGEATVNILIWPDYQDAQDLRILREVVAPRFAGLDASLILRVDPSHGETVDSVKAAIGDVPAQVGFLTGGLSPADWPTVGARFDGVLPLPASIQPARTALLEGLGAPILSVLRQEPDVSTAPASPATETRDRAALEDEIRSLDPWFYPLNIGGVEVQPGVTSDWDAQRLSNRIRCRRTLLVDGVAEYIDFQGKSVLELACNCGFWSSQYARLGANRFFGVEGRERIVKQGKLYWKHGGFLPPEQYQIVQGNVLDPKLWSRIREQAPFDVTLCAGLLYHLPDYRQLMAWIAAVTREAIIIDTRVTDQPETLIEEPGDLGFNAIEATRSKIVPNYRELFKHLKSLGFTLTRIKPTFESPPGLLDNDDYNQGARLTVIARKPGA
ncbi:MAG: methyltransferase domain-containing protein [Myxococcota bacterium]